MKEIGHILEIRLMICFIEKYYNYKIVELYIN